MNDLIKLAVIAGILVFAMIGWGVGGYVGAAVGLTFGVLLLVFPWRGQPLWSWLDLYLRRNRTIVLADPVTVANDRAGGGVRYQDGVAVAAIHVLGRPHRPTYFTGSTATETEDTLDISELLPEMHQSLGLTIESMSIISSGARRCSTGDYPRVYTPSSAPRPMPASGRPGWSSGLTP